MVMYGQRWRQKSCFYIHMAGSPSATQAVSPLNKNNPESQKKCFSVSSGFLQCFLAPYSHLTSQLLMGFTLPSKKAEVSFGIVSSAQHGQAHALSDPPGPASPGTICSSSFELCQDPIRASSAGCEHHLGLARNLVEQDLVVLVATKVPRSQQHVLAVKMVGHTLSRISKSAAQRCREVILPLYLSLVRPQLKHCVQFGLTTWTLSLWRYPKMVMELEHTR